MFVTSFKSRPTLHARQKPEGLRSMAYTLSDALSRYGADLTVEELGEAYRRAEGSFKGQLQQNFVVLHDRHGDYKKNKGGNAQANWRNVKRPRMREGDGNGEGSQGK